MQINLLFYTTRFLTFSVRPSLALVIFVHAPPPHQCREKTVALPKKLQMGLFDIYKHLGSFALFRFGYELSSLAVLFHGAYPEISSGGALQTFVRIVSFGVWQNQSKFEAVLIIIISQL